MSIQPSDTRFSWCNTLLRAKRNYNQTECANIVKGTIGQMKGADSAFVAHVSATQNNQLTYRTLYFPVYHATVSTIERYERQKYEQSGNVEITTTTVHHEERGFHTEVFTGIYEEIKPNAYVGKNDQCFHALSHVDDLDGTIYNDNCVYGQSNLEYLLSERTQKRKAHIGGEIQMNGYQVTVCFIPVLAVEFVYENLRYPCYVNMHNGHCYCSCNLSKKVNEIAKNACAVSKTFRIFTVLIAILATILSFVTYPDKNEHWLVGWFSIIVSCCAAVGLSLLVAKIEHGREYFQHFYGEKGDIGPSAYIKEFFYFLLACTSLLLVVALAVNY